MLVGRRSSVAGKPDISRPEVGKPGIGKPDSARPGVGRPGSPGREPDIERGKKGATRPALSLDQLIHERLRLGIVSALAANERLTFKELKHLLQTTDGNLSVHARKLEEAAYVICEKTFDGRMPRSEYRLTPAGRRALDKYVAHMEAILKAAKA